MFIVYAICNVRGITTINESDFIKADKNYLQIEADKISVEDFIKCENLESVDYILPGNSIINFKIKFDDYYQTAGYTYAFEGSLVSIDSISNNDIVKGRMPKNEFEIVLDKIIYDKMIEDEVNCTAYIGIKGEEEILGKKVFVDNMNDFTIVGFVDKATPSIYTDKSMFINLLNNTNTDGVLKTVTYITDYNGKEKVKVSDYNLYLDDITITKGRLPENDYEVIVNEINKDEIKLNKTIDTKVNNTKLIVVGYYDSKTNRQEYLVNNNTVKYNLISQSIATTTYQESKYKYNTTTLVDQNVIAMVYPKDKEEALNVINNEYHLKIEDKYEVDKLSNIEERKEVISSTVTFSSIILAISLIEIFLIIRSSFLSRIKEVGVLRAIGVKKLDIYKTFFGESIAITTCISLPRCTGYDIYIKYDKKYF